MEAPASMPGTAPPAAPSDPATGTIAPLPSNLEEPASKPQPKRRRSRRSASKAKPRAAPGVTKSSAVVPRQRPSALKPGQVPAAVFDWMSVLRECNTVAEVFAALNRIRQQISAADTELMANTAPYLSEVFDATPDTARTARHLEALQTHYVGHMSSLSRRQKRLHDTPSTHDGMALANGGQHADGQASSETEASVGGDDVAAHPAGTADEPVLGEAAALDSITLPPPAPYHSTFAPPAGAAPGDGGDDFPTADANGGSGTGGVAIADDALLHDGSDSATGGSGDALDRAIRAVLLGDGTVPADAGAVAEGLAPAMARLRAFATAIAPGSATQQQQQLLLQPQEQEAGADSAAVLDVPHSAAPPSSMSPPPARADGDGDVDMAPPTVVTTSTTVVKTERTDGVVATDARSRASSAASLSEADAPAGADPPTRTPRLPRHLHIRQRKLLFVAEAALAASKVVTADDIHAELRRVKQAASTHPEELLTYANEVDGQCLTKKAALQQAVDVVESSLALLSANLNSYRTATKRTDDEPVAPEGIVHAFRHRGDEPGAPTDVPMFVRVRLPTLHMSCFRTLAKRYEHGTHAILHLPNEAATAAVVVAHFAHIANTTRSWGPFLVVAPAAAVRLWQATFEALAPRLGVLPYWGEKRERQYMRRWWDPPLLGRRASPFHVLVTSQEVFASDAKHFKRLDTWWPCVVTHLPHALSPYFGVPSTVLPVWEPLLGISCQQRVLVAPPRQPLSEVEAVAAVEAGREVDADGRLITPPHRVPWRVLALMLPTLHSVVDSSIMKDAKAYAGRDFETASHRRRLGPSDAMVSVCASLHRFLVPAPGTPGAAEVDGTADMVAVAEAEAATTTPGEGGGRGRWYAAFHPLFCPSPSTLTFAAGTTVDNRLDLLGWLTRPRDSQQPGDDGWSDGSPHSPSAASQRSRAATPANGGASPSSSSLVAGNGGTAPGSARSSSSKSRRRRHSGGGGGGGGGGAGSKGRGNGSASSKSRNRRQAALRAMDTLRAVVSNHAAVAAPSLCSHATTHRVMSANPDAQDECVRCLLCASVQEPGSTVWQPPKWGDGDGNGLPTLTASQPITVQVLSVVVQALGRGAIFLPVHLLRAAVSSEPPTLTNLDRIWIMLAWTKGATPLDKDSRRRKRRDLEAGRLLHPIADPLPLGFARLEFSDGSVYIMRRPQVVLGRVNSFLVRCWRKFNTQVLSSSAGVGAVARMPSDMVAKKTELHPNTQGIGSVDVHLGNDAAVSRFHAVIRWNAHALEFELEVLSAGRSVRVNGVRVTRDDPPVPLLSRSLIQIGSHAFYFLLPRQLASIIHANPDNLLKLWGSSAKGKLAATHRSKRRRSTKTPTRRRRKASTASSSRIVDDDDDDGEEGGDGNGGTRKGDGGDGDGTTSDEDGQPSTAPRKRDRARASEGHGATKRRRSGASPSTPGAGSTRGSGHHPCSHKDCDAIFTRASLLRAHVLAMHATMHCRECNKPFTSRSSMKRHMTRAHADTNVGEHLCKLPFCSRRFHTARALQIHCTNSHAPFRFYPEDTGPKEGDRVTGALSKAWGHGENDTGSVVASVLDLVVRRVEYDAASTSERARMRAIETARVKRRVKGTVVSLVWALEDMSPYDKHRQVVSPTLPATAGAGAGAGASAGASASASASAGAGAGAGAGATVAASGVPLGAAPGGMAQHAAPGGHVPPFEVGNALEQGVGGGDDDETTSDSDIGDGDVHADDISVSTSSGGDSGSGDDDGGSDRSDSGADSGDGVSDGDEDMSGVEDDDELDVGDDNDDDDGGNDDTDMGSEEAAALALL